MVIIGSEVLLLCSPLEHNFRPQYNTKPKSACARLQSCYPTKLSHAVIDSSHMYEEAYRAVNRATVL